MGAVTDFFHRQTPHLTPTLIIGGCAILIPFFSSLANGMDTLEMKLNVNWYDIIKVYCIAAVGGLSGLQSFMSQSFGRYMKAREDKLLAESNSNESHGFVPPPEVKGK